MGILWLRWATWETQCSNSSDIIFQVKCKVLGRKGGERWLLLFEKLMLCLKKKANTAYVYRGHLKVCTDNAFYSILDPNCRWMNWTCLKRLILLASSKYFLSTLRQSFILFRFAAIYQSAMTKPMSNSYRLTVSW